VRGGAERSTAAGGEGKGVCGRRDEGLIQMMTGGIRTNSNRAGEDKSFTAILMTRVHLRSFFLHAPFGLLGSGSCNAPARTPEGSPPFCLPCPSSSSHSASSNCSLRSLSRLYCALYC
jgi:hypothetical protein